MVVIIVTIFTLQFKKPEVNDLAMYQSSHLKLAPAKAKSTNVKRPQA